MRHARSPRRRADHRVLIVAGLLPVTVFAAAPIASSDSVTTNEDTPKVIDLVGTDDDGDALTITIDSGPSQRRDSRTSPRPIASAPLRRVPVRWNTRPPRTTSARTASRSRVDDGSTTVVGTINITVDPQNDPPVAVNDPANPIVEDVTTTLDPLANDSDPDGDPLVITGTSGVTLGVVSIVSAGTRLSYNPTANAAGNDTFTYTISDGNGGTATATVTVQIGAVNDPPVAVNDPANPIVEDVTTTLDPLANDSDPDGDPLVITGTSGVTLGVVSIVSAGTRLSYNPTANAAGNDTFTYTISDGNGGTATATVTVQIGAVNDPPIAVNDVFAINEDSGSHILAVTTNDTDPDGPSKTVTDKTDPAHGILTLVAGVLTYTPALNFNGSDTFDYTVSDGSLTSTGTVTITVDPRERPAGCCR